MNRSVKTTVVIDESAELALMTVKETAVKSGLSAHTLRFYEKIGLVSPERADNGHRYYSSVDLARLDFIAKLRATGMPLALIQEYISRPTQSLTDLAKGRRLLEQHCQDVEAHLLELQENLRIIRVKIAYLTQVEKMAGSGMNLKSWLTFQKQQSLCGAELTIPKKKKSGK